MSSSLSLVIYTIWRALRHVKTAAKDTLSGTSNKDEGTQVKSTWLVNAAIAGSHRQAQTRDPYVVLLWLAATSTGKHS